MTIYIPKNNTHEKTVWVHEHDTVFVNSMSPLSFHIDRDMQL